MKKALFTLVSVIASYCSFAQTNTFPSSGNVGIGTTTPLNGLHIFSTNDFNTGSFRFGFSTTSDAVLSFGNDGISQDAFKISKFPHNSTTGSTNFLTILTNTGNVGIGTTTPKSNLHLMGTFIAGGNNANIDPAITANIPNNLANTGQMLIGWNRTAGAGETDFIGNQGGGGTGGFAFYNHDNSNTETQLMWIQGNGNVAIGTSNPNGYKLAVKGNVHAQQVNVDMNSWADYVFNKDYQPPALKEVKSYIDQNHHLPDMPSEQEVIKDGLNLGEMNKLLTKKVEELTLYLIEKDKQISEQQKVNQSFQQQLNYLMKQLKDPKATVKIDGSN